MTRTLQNGKQVTLTQLLSESNAGSRFGLCHLQLAQWDYEDHFGHDEATSRQIDGLMDGYEQSYASGKFVIGESEQTTPRTHQPSRHKVVRQVNCIGTETLVH